MNNENAAPEENIAADAPVEQAVPELTPEEAAAKAQAEFNERVQRCAVMDSSTFLSKYDVTSKFDILGNNYFRIGERFYVNEHATQMHARTVQTIATSLIAGQALIHALAPSMIFSVEDFQKVFNNVSLIDTTGCTEEHQNLAITVAIAMNALAWDAAATWREMLPQILDEATRRNVEQARIPATLNGGEFQGMEMLFDPGAGKFTALAGIILYYAPVDGEGGFNGIVLQVQDILQDGQTDEGLAAKIWLKNLVTARNAETEQFIASQYPGMLTYLVTNLGEQILKQPEAPTEAANDADISGSTEVEADGVEGSEGLAESTGE